MAASPSFPFIATDGITSLRGYARCDDGRNEIIASSVVVQVAVLYGICSFEAIKPVSIQVALTSGTTTMTFSFSRV